MFDMFDNLLIDDDYTSDGEYAVESGSYFDAENMYMDSALESFSYVDSEKSSDTEYFYAIESVLNAIETDLCAITMEADEAKKKFGEGFKDAAGKALQGVKNGIAKIFKGLYNICSRHANKCVQKGKTEKAVKWRKKADWCKQQELRLKGELSKEQIDQMKEQAEKTRRVVEDAVRRDEADWVGNPLIKKGENNNTLGGQKHVVATPNSERLRRANNAVNDIEPTQMPQGGYYENKEKNAVTQGKGVHVYTGADHNKKINLSPDEIERRKKEGQVLVNNAKKSHNISLNSFIVEDLDAGYSVAVEGLFSKPKTSEKLLARMQKKVGRLKSIGACDDMLRQLNAEASKFNQAISALKKASAEYSKTNDKKALRNAAGPVLKDLNKTCKILKIKSISSDPKNITQEEIKKLHDFITGAKQLITARKKVLSGAATESVISGFDDGFEYAAEGYEDDAFLSLMQDDYDYDGEIADEALIEDFDDADQNIAIATEGIIDPDTKRAFRIKFGEKKRQIQSIVKKARQAKKAKDFTVAISLYQEAKKGYQGLLADAKKLPDKYRGSEGSASIGMDGNGNISGGMIYAKNRKYASGSKTNLINWCIRKMGDCDNAIEAIRNRQMKYERKAKKASESYLDDALEYESVIESLNADDGFDDIFGDDYDDYDDYEGDGLESLLL